MSVSRADLTFQKSATVSDASSNGGRMSYNAVVNRAKYNLFPRVTRSERVAGVTRYRKEFVWNKNASNEVAFGVLVYLIFPSLAGDRFAIALGTQNDTQVDIDSDYRWFGAGDLDADVSASESEVDISFENTDVDITNGTMLAISNCFLSESISSAVKPFQQVYWTGSQWIPQNAPSIDQEDIHPYGTCIQLLGGGTGLIFTYHASASLEYHRVANPNSAANGSPAPNGSNLGPFTATATGYTPVLEGSVTVTWLHGAAQYQVHDNGLGVISGTGVASGSINYTNGSLSVTFDTGWAPDNGSQVVFAFAKKSFSWLGNVCTVTLEDTLLNNFLAADTRIGMCIEPGDLEPIFESVSHSGGSGTLDFGQCVGDNRGGVFDTWTIQFTSSQNFNCTGASTGSVGSGSIASDFSPTNIIQGQPYFTIDSAAWGGSFTLGETFVFKTYPPAAPIWWREIVPPATSAMANNVTMLEIYVE